MSESTALPAKAANHNGQWPLAKDFPIQQNETYRMSISPPKRVRICARREKL
jgi:hypothetical protein